MNETHFSLNQGYYNVCGSKKCVYCNCPEVLYCSRNLSIIMQ